MIDDNRKRIMSSLLQTTVEDCYFHADFTTKRLRSIQRRIHSQIDSFTQTGMKTEVDRENNKGSDQVKCIREKREGGKVRVC